MFAALAGLVWSIVMMFLSHDNNTVIREESSTTIYERIREEMRGGKGLKQALTDGYGKAYSAIFDANITTLLTAIVLYEDGFDAQEA